MPDSGSLLSGTATYGVMAGSAHVLQTAQKRDTTGVLLQIIAALVRHSSSRAQTAGALQVIVLSQLLILALKLADALLFSGQGLADPGLFQLPCLKLLNPAEGKRFAKVHLPAELSRAQPLPFNYGRLDGCKQDHEICGYGSCQSPQ